MKLACIALLVLLRSVAFSQSDSLLLAKAEEQLAAKKCKELERTISPLLKNDPPSGKAIVLKAKCMIWHEKKGEEGMQLLHQGLERSPDDFDLLYFRGDVYEDWHMFDRSEADLTRAVELAPDTADLLKALDRLTWTYHQMRMFDKALVHGRRALAIDSVDLGALNNLALLYSDLGDTVNAFAHLKKLMRVYPEDDLGWINMGFFLGTIGKHEQALGYYDEAEKRGRRDGRFYNNRGYSRLGVGDVKGARQDVERSIKLYPGNSYAYRNLALIEIKENKIGAACDALEKALQLGYTKIYGDEVIELRRKNCR
jgi:tetratricopeptide (TPR) repeat protein